MKNKENWIKETQRFQEIAGNPITSSKILSEEYDSFSTKLKNRCLSHIRALKRKLKMQELKGNKCLTSC